MTEPAPAVLNPVRQRLRQGRPVLGHWVSLGSAAVVEVLAETGAAAGMDWLMLDTEHSPAEGETVEQMIRAMKGTPVVPLVRVAGNDPVLIKKALDRGALGVLVPLVGTPEAARAAVAASRYPPEGIRGAAGTRANRYGADLPRYFAEWNRQVLVACQVETRQALEQVEAIAAVPGVDVLFIGPNDLSAALGCFRQFGHPAFLQAVERILRAARDHGIAAGYMTSGAEEALARIAQGFRFIALGSDARLLAAAVTATYEEVRGGLAAATRPEAKP
jgi:2-keto-3-deoxy-L-rhamnonate aldolase RhmA